MTKPNNFKISIFVFFIYLVFLLVFWSCKETIHLTKRAKQHSIHSLVDSTIPDSFVVRIDSLVNVFQADSIQDDNKLVEDIVLKEPFEQIFASNTQYQAKISVYEIHLDTASVTLIDGQYKHLKYIYDSLPNDYLMLTNGGMFHPQGIPVGLFQSDSIQVQRLNLTAGHGNFFLQPNGVFYITKDQKAGVLESHIFLDSIYNKETPLHLATQSGPMLIIDGKFHPKFNKNSPNKYIRSGVGVTDGQKIIFIISEEVVNLYTFAKMFRDKGCKNALYLDGAISSMYIRERGDNIDNFRTRYGPIIGVFPKRDSISNDDRIPRDSIYQSSKSKNENHEK